MRKETIRNSFENIWMWLTLSAEQTHILNIYYNLHAFLSEFILIFHQALF